MKNERWIAVLVLLTLGGCVSSSVQKGALIGAGTGAVLGAGTGLLVTEDSLLGPSASKERGDVTIDSGSAVVASTLVGLVFGGLIGAMAGKRSERPEMPPEQGGQAFAAGPSAF